MRSILSGMRLYASSLQPLHIDHHSTNKRQVAGGIVPVINIPLLDQTVGEMLVIDREVLSFIFMGNITKWNDQRVLSLQSPTVSAKLAQAADDIKIMVRKDGSGSTEVLTKSLNLYVPSLLFCVFPKIQLANIVPCLAYLFPRLQEQDSMQIKSK